jgi:hypothetical protein
MLFIYTIWFVVAYSEEALIVSLTNTGILISGSQVHMMLTGICFTVGIGIAAAAVTIFAILTLKPKHTKAFCIPPILVGSLHCLLWAIFGETLQPVGGLIPEWIPSPPVMGSMIAIAIMAFVPALLFLVYGIKIPTFRQKVSGITLAIGFLILGYFVFISDAFSIAPFILYRGICIALGIFIVYLGFITPRWYLKLLKRKKPAIKES